MGANWRSGPSVTRNPSCVEVVRGTWHSSELDHFGGENWENPPVSVCTWILSSHHKEPMSASITNQRKGRFLFNHDFTWQLLREWQMLVQRCSLSTLACIRKEQGRYEQVPRSCYPTSGCLSLENSLLARSLTPWLQAPNASPRCTRRGEYDGNFCAKGRCLCSAARWRHWLPYERSRDGNS